MLGSAAYSLETLLFDDQKDLPLAPRPLLDADWNTVGELTFSITALSALRLIDAAVDEAPTTALTADPTAAAAAAGAPVLTIGLSAFRAVGRGAAGAVQVQVEVDLPGDDEPLRTAPAPLKKGSAVLGFRRSYPMGVGTALRAAVAEALLTEDNKEDSDVLFVVVGLGKDGQASGGWGRGRGARAPWGMERAGRVA